MNLLRADAAIAISAANIVCFVFFLSSSFSCALIYCSLLVLNSLDAPQNFSLFKYSKQFRLSPLFQCFQCLERFSVKCECMCVCALINTDFCNMQRNLFMILWNLYTLHQFVVVVVAIWKVEKCALHRENTSLHSWNLLH